MVKKVGDSPNRLQAMAGTDQIVEPGVMQAPFTAILTTGDSKLFNLMNPRPAEENGRGVREVISSEAGEFHPF